VVLGYTAPLWVVPGAHLILGERITGRRAAGVGIGVAGLATMFNPMAFDWNDRNADGCSGERARRTIEVRYQLKIDRLGMTVPRGCGISPSK
jgi:hypothetical protein